MSTRREWLRVSEGESPDGEESEVQVPLDEDTGVPPLTPEEPVA